MKKSILLVNELQRYFNVVIIGSQLLVDNGLLDEKDTGDIDIAVPNGKGLSNITNYLEDLGFVGTVIEASAGDVAHIEYRSTEYDKVIDLNCFKAIPEVFTIPKLIANKFEQGRADDFKQLSMALFNKAGNTLKSYKELQEFYDNNQPQNEPEQPE